MKTFVVYDSFFGHTEKVAQAIANALESKCEVSLRRVNEVTPEQLQGVELLVAGSPTRGFTMSEQTAAFIKTIPAGGIQGMKVAAFDTRMPIKDVNNIIYTVFSSLFGFAAKKIAQRLEKKGGTLLLPPEGFAVRGSEGPLKEGELERAAEWGRQLAGKI